MYSEKSRGFLSEQGKLRFNGSNYITQGSRLTDDSSSDHSTEENPSSENSPSPEDKEKVESSTLIDRMVDDKLKEVLSGNSIDKNTRALLLKSLLKNDDSPSTIPYFISHKYISRDNVCELTPQMFTFEVCLLGNIDMLEKENWIIYPSGDRNYALPIEKVTLSYSDNNEGKGQILSHVEKRNGKYIIPIEKDKILASKLSLPLTFIGKISLSESIYNFNVK